MYIRSSDKLIFFKCKNIIFLKWNSKDYYKSIKILKKIIFYIIVTFNKISFYFIKISFIIPYTLI